MFKCIECGYESDCLKEVKEIEVIRPNIQPIFKPREYECWHCGSRKGFIYIELNA